MFPQHHNEVDAQPQNTGISVHTFVTALISCRINFVFNNGPIKEQHISIAPELEILKEIHAQTGKLPDDTINNRWYYIFGNTEG